MPGDLAPDLFEALQREPVRGAAPLGIPQRVEAESTDEVTAPRSIEEAAANSRAPAPAPSPQAGPAASLEARGGSLADLLEPMRAVAPPADPPDLADEPRSRSVAWGWIGATVLLAGALGWTLHTQTDLFQGNVVELRDAQALAEAEAERGRRAEEAKRRAKEYGSVRLDSTPDGARVYLLRDGPVATFENLPRGDEFVLLALAPGYAPQIKTVRGADASAPVEFELIALADPQAAARVPDHPVPAVADAKTPPKPEDTVSLTVKTAAPEARVGLLVGYTPGVTVLDLDVRQTHLFLVDKPGYAAKELALKGRHFEESSDGALIYQDALVLEPLPEPAITDEAPSAEGEPAAEAEAEPAAAVPRKSSKKKKKKQKRK
jgi:hypothetical protein